MSRRKPWTERAMGLLAGGAWHDREVIIKQIEPLIPDDAALAWATSKLRRPELLTPEQRLQSGRRGLAITCMHGRKMQTAEVDGVPQVRRRPIVEPQTPAERIRQLAGPNAAAWTERAVGELLDGQWHDQEAVLRAMMPLIPPARAYRKTEWARTRSSAGRSEDPPTERVKARSDAFLIASGRRSLAMSALQNRLFERKVEPDGTLVRLRPRQPSVPKPAVHQQREGQTT